MTKGKPQSNLRQGLTVLFFVINVFLFVAINTPADHFRLSQVIDSLDQQVTAPPAIIAPSSPNIRLEWKLEDRFRQGDWEVEKYREYEVHLDEENRIIKEIPTIHYNFLKYWRY